MSKVDSSDSSAKDDVNWDDTSVISIKDIARVYVPRWARVSGWEGRGWKSRNLKFKQGKVMHMTAISQRQNPSPVYIPNFQCQLCTELLPS